jgi:hypothetical protein
MLQLGPLPEQIVINGRQLDDRRVLRVIAGIIMWLRKRSDRKELAGKGAKPRLRPAE